MQSSLCDGVVDCSIAQAGLTQLQARDHSVLGIGKFREALFSSGASFP